MGRPQGGDDAAEAKLFAIRTSCRPTSSTIILVILDDYRHFRTGKGRPPLDR